jgi:hypothetical protein
MLYLDQTAELDYHGFTHLLLAPHATESVLLIMFLVHWTYQPPCGSTRLTYLVQPHTLVSIRSLLTACYRMAADAVRDGWFELSHHSTSRSTKRRQDRLRPRAWWNLKILPPSSSVTIVVTSHDTQRQQRLSSGPSTPTKINPFVKDQTSSKHETRSTCPHFIDTSTCKPSFQTFV